MLYFLLSLVGCLGNEKPTPEYSDDMVVMGTNLGEVEFQLYPEDSPITVENFLNYVDAGFYDGSDGSGATTFHRVVVDFVVQAGGWTADGIEKNTGDPIVNEALDSGLSNTRGMIAMARTSEPDSATSQFYINLVDNSSLDASAESAGYAVFGIVVGGMDVVDLIGGAAVDVSDSPQEAVVIESMSRKVVE